MNAPILADDLDFSYDLRTRSEVELSDLLNALERAMASGNEAAIQRAEEDLADWEDAERDAADIRATDRMAMGDL